jgi:hypothetical protein
LVMPQTFTMTIVGGLYRPQSLGFSS